MKYSIDEDGVISVKVLYPRDVDAAVEEMVKHGFDFNGWDKDDKSATFYLDYTHIYSLTDVDEEEYEKNKNALEGVADTFMKALSDYVTEM